LTCGLQPAICGTIEELEVAPFWPAKVASTRAVAPLHRSRALESSPSGPPARVRVKRLNAVSGRPSSVDCRRPPGPKPRLTGQAQRDRAVQVDDQPGQRRRGRLDQDHRPRQRRSKRRRLGLGAADLRVGRARALGEDVLRAGVVERRRQGAQPGWEGDLHGAARWPGPAATRPRS
jgi:hypothetical protein